jgi:hypothetical protein
MRVREGMKMFTCQSREIAKLDESCISDPKSEMSNWTWSHTVQFAISDFGSEMQDSSNLKFFSSASAWRV